LGQAQDQSSDEVWNMKRTLSLFRDGLVIACLIGGILTLGGFALGWNTPIQVSNIFFAGGATLTLFGLLCVIGGFDVRPDVTNLHVDLWRVYRIFFLLLLTGLFLVGFAVLVHVILR
jgi:hypothetical protein